ncbi:MAG: YARHG domain-containing protein [Terriglobia bacterium]
MTAVNPPAVAAPHHPSPPPVQAGMHLERQVLTSSGNLKVCYLRDRQQGTREIALQDAHNPSNETVLARYKRNAWVVVSPNDDWIVLENRDKGESGVQLYHRVSAAPLKYEVPEELRANGNALQDVIWQSYLSDTQQDPSPDPARVTIDATTWQPDSQKVTLTVSPIPTKDDSVLPTAWSCVYDVSTRQVAPAPEEVAEGPADQSESAAAPDEATEAPAENAATSDEAQAAPAGEESQDLEGEKFPATREEEITVADANELDLSDVRYAIFEMFARHGADMHDPKMKKAFSQFSWYQPREGVSFDDIEKEFSDVEKHNVEVLRRVRDAKVAAAHRPESRPIHGQPVDEESNGQRVLRGVLQGVSDALNGGDQ